MRSTQRFQEEMWRNFDYPRPRKKKKVNNKMNGKIGEFLLKTGVNLKTRRLYFDKDPDGYLESDDDFFMNNHEAIIKLLEKGGLEKFTALIVRECIAWSIENKYVEANYDGLEFTKGLNDHFGIE